MVRAADRFDPARGIAQGLDPDASPGTSWPTGAGAPGSGSTSRSARMHDLDLRGAVARGAAAPGGGGRPAARRGRHAGRRRPGAGRPAVRQRAGYGRGGADPRDQRGQRADPALAGARPARGEPWPDDRRPRAPARSGASSIATLRGVSSGPAPRWVPRSLGRLRRGERPKGAVPPRRGRPALAAGRGLIARGRRRAGAPRRRGIGHGGPLLLRPRRRGGRGRRCSDRRRARRRGPPAPDLRGPATARGTFTAGDLIRLDRGASPAMHEAAAAGLVTIEHCCLDFDGGGPADDGLIVHRRAARPRGHGRDLRTRRRRRGPGRPRRRISSPLAPADVPHVEELVDESRRVCCVDRSGSLAAAPARRPR